MVALAAKQPSARGEPLFLGPPARREVPYTPPISELVGLGNEAALGMESPTDALSANVSVMPVWSLAITSRGLHVGRMGTVVVHCMGTSPWRQPKPAPFRVIGGFYREWRAVIGVATRSSASSFPRSSVYQKNWRGFGARSTPRRFDPCSGCVPRLGPHVALPLHRYRSPGRQ
jgi:hypothetical protein